MKKSKLLIIDTMALAFRSFYAIPSLTTPSGQPINAVYGALLFLWQLIEKNQPEYLVFASDSKEPTFRHQLYPAYKANRSEMPAELASQIPQLYQMLEALQAPVLRHPGLEADDLIGSLVTQWASDELQGIIVSGDKDFMQLVGPNVSLLLPKKGTESLLCETQGVFDKFGCRPDQVIDILALMGDSSDNVPGVPGIGEKGATKLIQQFHSLDGIYANLSALGNTKQRENLETHRDLAYLSKDLVTIRCDHPLTVELKALRCSPDHALSNPELLALLEEWQFSRFIGLAREKLKKMAPAVHEDKTQTKHRGIHSYQWVRTEGELEAFRQKLMQAERFSFDTETTGLDRCSDKPIAASFALAGGEAFFLPLVSEGLGKLPLEVVKKVLAEVLGREDALKIGHNLKFDLQMLGNIGIEVNGPLADTMLASYLIDPTERSHSLDACCLRTLNFQKIPSSEVLAGRDTMFGADPNILMDYACEDADYTYRLFTFYQPLLQKLELTQLFERVEMPLVPILAKMERGGVHIDSAMLLEISSKLAALLGSLELSIYEQAGGVFNINSPKQLGSVLFEQMKIQDLLGVKRIKKTKSGYSTDVTVLEQLSEHPLPRALLEYRQLSKLKSTYVDALPQMINPASHRLHTHFHQAVTATGRLSSSDPNLQNIPVRSAAGREIRKAFRAAETGWVIISADYSQIELRLLAALADEKNLKEAFAQGIDIHRATAAKILGIAPDAVTAEQRSQAKAINFGIIYGMGPQRLAKQTGVSMHEAKDFIDRYFLAYPRIKTYIEQSISFARANEYTSTILGRRRPLKEINHSRNGSEAANAQNIAVNSPVQGSAADLIKKAMIDVQKRLDVSSFHARMLLQVHDELVFECPREECEAVMVLIREAMEETLDVGVPLKVEVGYGDNWLEAH